MVCHSALRIRSVTIWLEGSSVGVHLEQHHMKSPGNVKVGVHFLLCWHCSCSLTLVDYCYRTQ